MRVISGIVASPRRAGRWVLQVDGRPAATLSIEGIERLGIRVGASYDARLAAAVEREAAVLGAFDTAVSILAFRARSVRDVRRRLIDKGESEAVADAAIARLESLGLLSDREFARQFARSRVLGPGLSKRRLQQELFKRGVARDVADEAIGEVMAEDDVDEDAIIDRVARKKLRTLAKLDPLTRRRRLYAFLARRGYEPDDIRRVMADLAADDGDEPADVE